MYRTSALRLYLKGEKDARGKFRYIAPVVAMTTAQVNISQTTDEVTVTSTWSPGADFYFVCAVIIIGIVGGAANAVVLYALVASKQHKKQMLIVNQNALDVTSCLFLVVIYTLKVSDVVLTGLLGYWLCMLLLSENLLWFAIDGSIINLAVITVERYLKVVHPVWSQNKLRRRRIYPLIAFPWVISLIYNMALSFTTSAVIDGACHGVIVWQNHVAKMVHGVYHFLSFYVIILLIFVVCYWRILAAIRRQASVMAAHTAAGSGTSTQSTAAQSQAIQIQCNVIKTMILVCTFYAVAWLPENVYYLLVDLGTELTFNETGYYAAVFVSFLYVCTNPFIYATKFDPVKRSLLSLIPCKSHEQPAGNVAIWATATRAATARTVEERNL